MGKYTIIGRQRNGTIISGYILRENATGRIGAFPKETVYRLAIDKQINDVITQEYNGRITMKGTKYKISDLPNYDENGKIIPREQKSEMNAPKMIINGKVVDGKNVVAYRVARVVNGVVTHQTILDRDSVIKYAKSGAIANVRYQKSNGADILRGVDCNLAKLPIIEKSYA